MVLKITISHFIILLLLFYEIGKALAKKKKQTLTWVLVWICNCRRPSKVKVEVKCIFFLICSTFPTSK